MFRKIRAQRLRRYWWAWHCLGAQTMELASQTEVNSSTSPSWLRELGQGLLGFSLFIYTNLTGLGWEVSHTVKQWAQSKHWTQAIKYSINCSCITINITIKKANLNESGIGEITQKSKLFIVHFIYKEHLESSRKHACFHVLLCATIFQIEIFNQYTYFFNLGRKREYALNP